MTKYTPEQRIAKFWSNIDQSGGPDACWPWTGARNTGGYGNVWRNGHALGAHRVTYELLFGPIPDGLCVCHQCDRPECNNPAHLWLGTHTENMIDRDRKGRHIPLQGEKHGMCKVTDAQVDEMRQLYKDGNTNKSKLGRQFGITHGQASRIVREKKRIRPKLSDQLKEALEEVTTLKEERAAKAQTETTSKDK